MSATAAEVTMSEPHTTATPREDALEFDLGNLAAFDAHAPAFKSEHDMAVYTRDNVQTLIARLFLLPSQKLEVGRLASLPHPTTALPREKPVPKPKQLTKWEQFALTKGITKHKREKQVYDEASGEFRRRFGYKRANDESNEIIIEDRPGLSAEDPFLEIQQKKRARVDKQLKQQASNFKRALANDSATSSATPKASIALSAETGSTPQRRHKKDQVIDAMTKVKFSTASMGKFDEQLSNEPKVRDKSKRRVRESNEMSAADEKTKSLKLLDRVLAKSDKVNASKAANVSQQLTEKSRRFEKKREMSAGSGGGKSKFGGASGAGASRGRGGASRGRGGASRGRGGASRGRGGASRGRGGRK